MNHTTWHVDALPPSGVIVLAATETSRNLRVVVRAVYVTKHDMEAWDGWENTDYDAEEDVHYIPEGWYEASEIISTTGEGDGCWFPLPRPVTQWTTMPCHPDVDPLSGVGAVEHSDDEPTPVPWTLEHMLDRVEQVNALMEEIPEYGSWVVDDKMAPVYGALDECLSNLRGCIEWGASGTGAPCPMPLDADTTTAAHEQQTRERMRQGEP